MTLSSNSLFHFTPELKYLEDILKNGFWPRYCREYGWGNRYIDFALPMVCFCDIPLSMISEHASFYGQFGIGLAPGWVRSNKDITPVQYVSTPSFEYDSINRILTRLKNKSITESEVRKLQLVKKVSGKAINKKGKQATKKFYDEREWRFVPSLDNQISSVKKGQMIDIEKLSEDTKDFRLKLSMNDIRYLLIPNEVYRAKLISIIRDIYKAESADKIDVLISRIITLKQIEEDF